jgi:hypothetical protein
MPDDRFFLARPYLQADLCQLFIDAFAEAFPHRLHLLLLDNRGAHTAEPRSIPANMRLVCLPPDGPALNPMARVWRDLKDALAWLQFPPLEAQQASRGDLWQADQASTLHSLTSDPYVVEAIQALGA